MKGPERTTTTKFALLVLSFLASFQLSGLACQHGDYQAVVFENRTDRTVTILVDGKRAFFPEQTVASGQQIRAADRKLYWQKPRRVQAVDEEGNIIFDRMVELDALEADGFKVVIVLQPQG